MYFNCELYILNFKLHIWSCIILVDHGVEFLRVAPVKTIILCYDYGRHHYILSNLTFISFLSPSDFCLPDVFSGSRCCTDPSSRPAGPRREATRPPSPASTAQRPCKSRTRLPSTHRHRRIPRPPEQGL